MLMIPFLLIIAFGITIAIIIFKYNESKIIFQNRINLLESIIFELNAKLEHNNQKVKLSEDLKLNMRNANNHLSAKIVAMNLEMFGELFVKKV